MKLKESKTDPFRRGICIQLHKINHSICPFLILQKYIASRIERRIYSSSCDPLFITEFGQPLDRNYFIGKLKHVLQLVGYDSSLYNGHSFRSGGATSAGQALIQDNMIKTLGRWSSQSYCTYIKASKNTIKQAQQSLTNSSVDNSSHVVYFCMSYCTVCIVFFSLVCRYVFSRKYFADSHLRIFYR